MSLYYTYTPLTPNTVARAADVNSRFNGVSAGFDLLPNPQLLSEDRITYSADTGVANSYIATPSTPLTAYNAGLRIRLQATFANTTASTVNVSGLGVKQIVRSDGSALQAGDIVAGQILDLTYDGINFRLAMAFAEMSPAGVASKIAAAGNIVVNGSLSATSLNIATITATTVTATSLVNNGQTINALTATGVGLVQSASIAAARAYLGLGSAALSATTDFLTAVSPALTGTPTAPTAAPGMNTTQIATTAFVGTAVTNVGSSLNMANATSGTLAVARGGTGVTTSTGTGNTVLSASPALTGIPTSPTAAVDTNTTQVATTAYVVAQGYLKSATAASTYVAANNAALTGTPTAPTPATGVNTTQIATTAYVQANLANYVTTGTLGAYAGLNSPQFTGDPRAVTTATSDNSISIATTAYVKANLGAYAPLASPGLTGTPTAPTAAIGTSTVQIATTAFVDRLRALPTRTDAGTSANISDRGGAIICSAGTCNINPGVFAQGDVVTIYNGGATATTIGQISGMTLRLAGTTTTGTRTLVPYGLATLYFSSGSDAVVSGNVT